MRVSSDCPTTGAHKITHIQLTRCTEPGVFCVSLRQFAPMRPCFSFDSPRYRHLVLFLTPNLLSCEPKVPHSRQQHTTLSKYNAFAWDPSCCRCLSLPHLSGPCAVEKENGGDEGTPALSPALHRQRRRRRGSSVACPVCLNVFQPRDAITLVTCGHAFHWKCVEPWLEQSARCPCCRSVYLRRRFKENLEC